MNSINKQHIIAALFCSVISYSFTSIAGEKIDDNLAVGDANTVAIENMSGEITVIGWDNANVSVKGELDDKAEKLTFEQVGNSINIKVELPNHGSWSSEGSNLTIYMPSTLRMSFDGISSDIKISNLTNSINVKTVSGDVQASKLQQYIELSSVSGNIESENLTGKITLATVSGNIDDKNSTGRLQLQAVSGDISVKSTANEVFVNNVSGSIKLNLDKIDELKLSTVSGDSEVSLHLQDNGITKALSVSGSIELYFQHNVSADFRLKASADGDLHSKLTKQKVQREKYGPSSKLYFQTGDATGSVRVSTVSGDVVVE